MSIDGFGSGVRLPSGAWSNCMNTRFQNSMNRSPAGSPSGPPSGPNAGPRSMWISLHGPHGPVSPACQKLSLSPRRWMRSIGTPTISCQIASASSSDSCTVIHSRSPSKPQPPVGRVAGDEVPAPRDRRLLEVVAEAEVAEHLEEHEVALGAPDVVEVVVLAAGASALLRADRAEIRRLFVADEVRLERQHARHVEQHGRVVRDEARRRHDRVVLRGEEVAEGVAQLVGVHRGGHIPGEPIDAGSLLPSE